MDNGRIGVITELHISTFNKEGLRHKEGDIINVLPAGDLGRKILDYYLIVPVNTNLNLTQELCVNLYADGSVEGKDWREIDLKDEVSPYIDRQQNVIDVKSMAIISRPEKTAKNRYQIELSSLGDIDLQKAQSPEIIYQPFLTEQHLVNMSCFTHPDSECRLIRKNGNYYSKHVHRFERKIYEEVINGQTIRFIRPKEPAIRIALDEDLVEIFCSTPTIPKNQGMIFSINNLIKDKFDNSYFGVAEIGQ